MKFIYRIPRLLRLITLSIVVLALLLIALFFIAMKSIGLTFQPTSNMISRIESTGRDAICADLIGKWLIRGDYRTWEFTNDGTFIEVVDFLNHYRMVERYTCDDSTRTARIPFAGPGAPTNGYTAFCCTTVRLGSIAGDRMVIYVGGYNEDPRDFDIGASRIRVIEKK